MPRADRAEGAIRPATPVAVGGGSPVVLGLSTAAATIPNTLTGSSDPPGLDLGVALVSLPLVALDAAAVRLADRLAEHLPWLAGVGAVGVVAAIGVAVLGGVLWAARWAATCRTLRGRISVAVLPADTFDPSIEDVTRYAQQLTRVRRVVWGWLDRRAGAIRIRLTATGDGELLYILQGPRRAASVLRLPGYDQVELRAVEALPAGAGIARGMAAAQDSRPAPEVAPAPDSQPAPDGWPPPAPRPAVDSPPALDERPPPAAAAWP